MRAHQDTFRGKLHDVNVSLVLDTILKIDEVDEIFYVSFGLHLQVTTSSSDPGHQWRDPRITYNNLKRNPDLNMLTTDLQAAIWAPQVHSRKLPKIYPSFYSSSSSTPRPSKRL